MLNLTASNGLIFRITHIENVPWILQNGLHSRNSNIQDPNFVQIGNPDLIAKRVGRAVPIAPGGTLADYVPFYFTPATPMLYNIKTGWNGMKQTPMREIVVLTTSLPHLVSRNQTFLFTDSHAFLQTAGFFSALKYLNKIDWKILQARDFQRDANDLGKMERYQAEALIFQNLPTANLMEIGCHDGAQASKVAGFVQAARLGIGVAAHPEWYV